MLGKTAGAWLVVEQEAQLKGALLKGPKTTDELIAALNTTERRINTLVHKLHSSGEVHYADGRWHLV